MNLHLQLRAPEPDDLDVLFRWENDPEQWDNALCSAVVSRHALWNYLQNCSDDIFAEGQVRFMIDALIDDALTTVGTIDLCDFCGRDRRAFVSIFIDKPYRGRGYGSQALAAVVHIALLRYNIEQLAAIIAADNQASLSLFAAAGFTTGGVLRSWLSRGQTRVDAHLLQLQLYR
jgi:diamine N-acetyltransferase